MSNDILLSIVSITLLVLLLIAGIVITFFISGRQRIKQQMELTQAKMDFEKELRQVETEVSEHMMTHFAQELHDNIGQLLTAMHIQVENQKLDHPHLAEGFKPLEIYLDEVSQQLRLLSRTLNNDYLGHIGLLAAINLEVERLRALRRFTIHWQPLSGTTHLEKNQELMLFRVFQEIIQNALRHSGANNLTISVNLSQGFELSIKDDGKGFDKDAVMQSGQASGLLNISKRCRLAGIGCVIESQPGKGSLFILKKIGNLD